MQGSGLLSLLIWVPIGGGLITLAFGDARARLARWFALLISLATLALVFSFLSVCPGSRSCTPITRLASMAFRCR
jgi:NADH:ubiquinone oxidoreductase subunit 4 (subunit M)